MRKNPILWLECFQAVVYLLQKKESYRKIKQEIKDSDNDENDDSFPDDAYLMVTQHQWEDEIIWSGEEARQRVMQSQKTKALAAGWIPSTSHRTAAQFMQQSKENSFYVVGSSKYYVILTTDMQFSFPHNFLFPSESRSQFFSHIYFVVCKCFQFGPV